jgi:biopolymer transport protein ExbD
MAFASGGKGVRSDINVTPLIDVVLVLLIVFMVLVPKLLNQTQVDVPPKAPDNQDTPPASDQLVVTVGEDSRIAINGEAILLEGLADKVRNLMTNRSKKLMFFNPDDNAPYGDVVKVMDICRGAGVKTLGIMTK